MLHDPISNMIAILKQAVQQKRISVLVTNTCLIQGILNILVKLGFITFYRIVSLRKLRVFLKYNEYNKPAIQNIQRLSKFGSRIYISYKTLKYFEKSNNMNNTFSTVLISTSRGILTNQSASRLKIGGEPILVIN